jgi:hypothetical protein
MVGMKVGPLVLVATMAPPWVAAHVYVRGSFAVGVLTVGTV